jgi:hypothetical protein
VILPAVRPRQRHHVVRPSPALHRRDDMLGPCVKRSSLLRSGHCTKSLTLQASPLFDAAQAALSLQTCDPRVCASRYSEPNDVRSLSDTFNIHRTLPIDNNSAR